MPTNPAPGHENIRAAAYYTVEEGGTLVIQATVEKMNAMKLSAMAEACERQLPSSEYAS